MSFDHTQTHLAWSQRITKEQRDADWFQSSTGTSRGSLTPRWQQLNRMLQPDYATNFDFVRSRTALGLTRPTTRAQLVRQYLSTVKTQQEVLRFAFNREHAGARSETALNRLKLKDERKLGRQTDRPRLLTDLQRSKELRISLPTYRVKQPLAETKPTTRSLHSLRH